MTNETQIKERPILFSTQMVQTVLPGDKTQTRRPIKKKEGLYIGKLWNRAWPYIDKGGPYPLLCPHGKPGDRLWVKETFYAYGFWDTRWSYKKGREEWYFTDLTQKNGLVYLYHADETPKYHPIRVKYRVGYWKRPAIFMPRAASRILLGINDLWPERLHDISEEDAKAEGVSRCYETSEGNFVMPDKKTDFIVGPSGSYYTGFKSIWHSINGPESWNENPFVWAIDFKRIEP